MLETIKELLASEPFAPFQIVMTSGDKYRVENPALVTLGEAMISYFLPFGAGTAHLRLNQVVLLQVDELKV